MDHLTADHGLQVLIPPDGGKRQGERPGVDRRAVLVHANCAGHRARERALPQTPGVDRAGVRQHQAQPQDLPPQLPRQIISQNRVAAGDAHPQPPKAPPPPDRRPPWARRRSANRLRATGAPESQTDRRHRHSFERQPPRKGGDATVTPRDARGMRRAGLSRPIARLPVRPTGAAASRLFRSRRPRDRSATVSGDRECWRGGLHCGSRLRGTVEAPSMDPPAAPCVSRRSELGPLPVSANHLSQTRGDQQWRER